MTCDYNLYGTLENFFRKKELRITDTAYAADVTAELLMEPEGKDALIGELTDLLNGRISFEDRGTSQLAVPV